MTMIIGVDPHEASHTARLAMLFVEMALEDQHGVQTENDQPPAKA